MNRYITKRITLSAVLLIAITVLAGCNTIAWPGANNTAVPTDQELADYIDSRGTDVVGDSLTELNSEIESVDRTQQLQVDIEAQLNAKINPTYQYPMVDYVKLRTKKSFGQFIAPNSGDRFSGYHTGDDIEVTDIAAEVPVYALADSTVVSKQTLSGYGGVVILEFTDATAGSVMHALYGHVDLESVKAAVGDVVKRGDLLGNLGDDKSPETDGERKHLHFGLYIYTGAEQYAGYVQNESELNAWVNPSEFFTARGL